MMDIGRWHTEKLRLHTDDLVVKFPLHVGISSPPAMYVDFNGSIQIGELWESGEWPALSYI